MSKAELDNLVRIGKLKLEPASRVEFSGMVTSAPNTSDRCTE
jgi:hypothetical protein